MNPKAIINELRRINAWRRGDETVGQPAPGHFGDVMDDAAILIEQTDARCIEREERIEQMAAAWDKTKADLARVTAERDAAKAEALGNAASYRDADARRAENYRIFTTVQGERDVAKRSIVALRARVAEQYAKGYDDCKREYEEKLVSLSAITAEWRDGCNFQSERAEKTEQCNAELVAALRKLHRVMSAWLECYGHRTGDAAEEWRRKYYEARRYLRAANRGAQRNAMVAELAHARFSRPNTQGQPTPHQSHE